MREKTNIYVYIYLWKERDARSCVLAIAGSARLKSEPWGWTRGGGGGGIVGLGGRLAPRELQRPYEGIEGASADRTCISWKVDMDG